MRGLIVLTLGLALAATAGCDPDLALPAEPPDPSRIHIGILNPFSGREASRAIDFQDATRLAVAEINEAGGVNGQLLDVISRDSKTNEPEAVATSIAAIEELADFGAVAVVGPDTSSLVVALRETLVARGLPLISATATASRVSMLDDDDLIWRTCASDNLQGAALAARIRRDGVQTVAIVHIDDTYGAGLAATVATELTGAGGEVMAIVAYPDGKLADFEPEVTELLAAGVPDAIVVVGFALDSAGVMTALLERGLDPLPARYGVDGNHNQAFLRNAPREVILGMRLIAPASPIDNPELVRFEAAHLARLGKPPFRTEFSYDAVYLIALAMVEAGDSSAAAVHDHLRAVSRADGLEPLVIGVGPDELRRAAENAGRDLDFQGASGAINFDAAGDVTAATFAIREIQETADGLGFVELERVALP